METQTPATPATPAVKEYVSLPPEVEEKPEGIFSVRFVIFGILVIGVATGGGLEKSGRISVSRYLSYFGGTKAGHVFVSAGGTAAPAASAAPVAPFKADVFVVTSISVGQPSFAIINGTSRVVGDPVTAPGLIGWKVRQITDNAVIVQNGSTVASLPLSTPGFKPLDDSLHPLN